MDDLTPAPDETQDKPVEADAPAEGGQGEDTFTNFNLADVPEENRGYVEAAYNQLRADYTRKRQEESAAAKEWQDERDTFKEGAEFYQQFQDPDYQQQLLREMADHYGLTIAEAQAIQNNADTGDEYLKKAEYEQREQERAEAAQYAAAQEAEVSDVAAQLAQIEEAEGALSDNAVKMIVAYAVNNPTPDGSLNLTDAHAIYKGEIGTDRAAYIASKKAPQVQGTGTPGSEQPNLNDPEERVAYMASLIEGEAA